jgi:hypothetical protein
MGKSQFRQPEKSVYCQRKSNLKHKAMIIGSSSSNLRNSQGTIKAREHFSPNKEREASDYLHSKGKLTQVHADGEMRRLIPLFLETGVDVAEAWSPTPMTSVITGELGKAWELTRLRELMTRRAAGSPSYSNNQR